MGRQEPDVERLERLREQRARLGWRAGEGHVLIPDASAFQVRESDDDRSRRQQADRHHRHDRRPRGNGERASGDGQLSRPAGRHRADRTHARAGRRQSRGAGRRHAERSLLADAVRGRSRRAGQNHQHQQSSCDHRRRDAGRHLQERSLSTPACRTSRCRSGSTIKSAATIRA